MGVSEQNMLWSLTPEKDGPLESRLWLYVDRASILTIPTTSTASLTKWIALPGTASEMARETMKETLY